MRRFSINPRFWASATLTQLLVQAVLLESIQKLHPEAIWMCLFVQCAVPMLLMPRPSAESDDWLRMMTNTEVIQRIVVYMASLLLPQVAFVYAPEIATVTLATLFQSAGVAMMLILQRDRSLIRGYGTALITFAVVYVVLKLVFLKEVALGSDVLDSLGIIQQRVAHVWNRLIAVVFLVAGAFASALLVQRSTRLHLLTLNLSSYSALLIGPLAMFHSVRLGPPDPSTVIIVVLYAVSTIIGAGALQMYANATHEDDSREMIYFFTLLRFLIIVVGSSMRSADERETLLISTIIIMMGTVLIEAHFVVEEKQKKQREPRARNEQEKKEN